MHVIIIFKKKAIKSYDLTSKSDTTQLKRHITCAINTEDFNRLREIRKQLQLSDLQIRANIFAEEQLEIVTSFLEKENKLELPDSPARALCEFTASDNVENGVRDNDSALDDADSGRVNPSNSVVYQEHCVDSDNELITNVHYFPRSEYYTRFYGTTAFMMDEPEYWGTYHRSESSRFFSIAGGRSKAQFSSPCVEKLAGTHSFHAHTGGFHSPFFLPQYNEDFNLENLVAKGEVNIRDRLICYKRQISQIVVGSFEDSCKQGFSTQKIKLGVRPIVFFENNYPCVMVALPVLNSLEIKDEAVKYWSKHPKPFQRLLICSFVALLNTNAAKKEIPIEIVLRASFGHNLPSICETDKTFRINVGVIPKCYAQLIGETLYELKRIFEDILNKESEDILNKESKEIIFDENFLANVRRYNAKKLQEVIKNKTRYEELRNNENFKLALESEESFEQLYRLFCEKNDGKPLKNSGRFIPVRLKDKTIWEAIRQPGDSMGKSLLSECFRKKGTEDWLINQIMLEMDARNKIDCESIEKPVKRLLGLVKYGKKVTMDYKTIYADLKKEKRKFATYSFQKIYGNDQCFLDIIGILFEGFGAERPSEQIYSKLERAGTDFFISARGSERVVGEPDYGSDSDFDVDLTIEKGGKVRFSHRKLRVCSGMKAILAAHYGALHYLKSHNISKYQKDNSQMYYEVENALKFVDNALDDMSLNKVRAEACEFILHFDLNHCNASNSINTTLKKKLDKLQERLKESDTQSAEEDSKLGEKPSEKDSVVVILDFTSATTYEVYTALSICFSMKHIGLVMLVESGLKNSQGGLDVNPYGELRLCARRRDVVNSIYGKIVEEGLSEDDKLPVSAHEKVRGFKKKGYAVSAVSMFGRTKIDEEEYKPADKEHELFPPLSSKINII